ncbi:biotin/lipoyl-binding protein [Pseudomonas cichorii]|uniref:biotin/lipoyl-binding protein n=1 Tax=Pseudomonas cichorii TaxID=36746 RepID=UPI000EFEE3F4|nr:biotin/lipoyl-binding protein [Pseudomonas cichorii]
MSKLSFSSAFTGQVFMNLAALCINAIACSVLFIGTHTAVAAEQTSAALTVTVGTVTQAQWPEAVEASGAIAPWEEAVIGSQVSGLRLAEILVNVGDRVKRGQLLATFDADLLGTDEVRLKASWQQAEANRQRASQQRGYHWTVHYFHYWF